ncbi:uncharacterized protein BYT42DRAFT_544189 [Radiomyces spectabilis]|uniref:uncharacterized protein n=1 Tax=Radiomyces spectabilis TaxID=64574 RepID=UPI0022201729|nr:uncharacterized protein BYT42DRAFT_544189 [Radiomyces spectabilis]KAI8384262.1 hypothetical protein BYT42DRAFT_544189 [Radiomyces spectabilis]
MAQFDWLVQPETARRNFVKLVYSYLAWIALHQLLDAHHIFQMLGISIILWRHPMIVKVRAHFAGLMFRDVVDALFIGPVAESTVSSQYPLMQRALAYQQSIQSNGHSDRSINDQDFEFVVYENQRRQPFGKWTTGTLPFERSAWSDEAKQPVPPCSKFVLPPPSVMVVESSSHPQRRWQKTWTWVWTDDDWSTDGWEYGTLLWTSFSSHSQKGFWPTRRRQWKRRASIERHVKTVDAPVSVSIKGHVPTERTTLDSFQVLIQEAIDSFNAEANGKTLELS